LVSATSTVLLSVIETTNAVSPPASGPPSTATVHVVLAPQAPTITAPAIGTVGTTLSAAVTMRPGMTYTWTVDTGAITSPGGSAGVVQGGSNTITFVPAVAGPVHLTATETNAAGDSATGFAALTAVGLLPAPVVSIPANVTVGTSYPFTLIGAASAPYSCTITNGALTSGATGTLSNVGGGGGSFTPGASGAVIVSCTETNAAATPSPTGNASAAAWAAVVTPVIGVVSAATAGRTYTASVPTHSGATYAWSVDGGSSSISSAGGAAGVTAAGVNSIQFASGGPGTRTLTCIEINGAGDASSPGSFLVQVVPPAVTPVLLMPSFVTVSVNYVASAAVNTGAGSTFFWTVSNGVLLNGTGGSVSPGIASQSIQPPAVPGSVQVTLTVTNLAGDSSATGVASATIVPAPTTPVPTIPASMTSGTPYTLSTPAHGGMTYLWTVDDGALDNAGGTTLNGVNSVVVSGLTPGTLHITVREINAAGLIATFVANPITVT
jgi:hypothetical protein